MSLRHSFWGDPRCRGRATLRAHVLGRGVSHDRRSTRADVDDAVRQNWALAELGRCRVADAVATSSPRPMEVNAMAQHATLSPRHFSRLFIARDRHDPAPLSAGALGPCARRR